MIEEIKRRLDAGREVELECVDKYGLKKEHYRYELLLRLGRFIVSKLNGEDIFFNDSLVGLSENHLKYFRIKESSATFDDLIDLAFKALKDGVVKEIGLFDNILMIQESHEEAGRMYITINEVNQNGVCKYLGYIDSLYTETFVIESEEDVMRSKIDSITKLTNGQELQCRSSNLLIYRDENDRTVKLSFCILKGATVTQKRGNQ